MCVDMYIYGFYFVHIHNKKYGFKRNIYTHTYTDKIDGDTWSLGNFRDTIRKGVINSSQDT